MLFRKGCPQVGNINFFTYHLFSTELEKLTVVNAISKGMPSGWQYSFLHLSIHQVHCGVLSLHPREGVPSEKLGEGGVGGEGASRFQKPLPYFIPTTSYFKPKWSKPNLLQTKATRKPHTHWRRTYLYTL